jgi:hypothetical protein
MLIDMPTLLAKTVVKNKFYIVERNGEQVATIQISPAGAAFVQGTNRERFASIKHLEKKHNVVFEKRKVKDKTNITTSRKNTDEVYGYEITGRAYNQRWEITRKLPIYTKSAKSKSFYCAGYYLLKMNKYWTIVYCPKMITLNRYEFKGPYKTSDLANCGLEEVNG